MSADSGYDPLDYDVFGRRLPEHIRRWRDDPNHWFNDQEDNRYWEQHDRDLMAGRCGAEVLEEIRRMEEAGQTTVTINGREYPAAVRSNIEKFRALARERERSQTESPS